MKEKRAFDCIFNVMEQKQDANNVPILNAP